MKGIGEMTTDSGGLTTRIGGVMTETKRKTTDTGVKTTRTVEDSATNHRRAIMLTSMFNQTLVIIFCADCALSKKKKIF